MKIFLLILALFSFTANANDYVGIPIGNLIDFEPIEAETKASKQIIIEGPFKGLFSIFGQYKAHVSVTSKLLIMAEAEKIYSSFEICSSDTIQIWEKLKQKFGKPAQDDNQTWWFNIEDQQKISINCRIYGASGKIAMNITVVDSDLAVTTMKEWEEKTLNQ